MKTAEYFMTAVIILHAVLAALIISHRPSITSVLSILIEPSTWNDNWTILNQVASNRNVSRVILDATQVILS